MEDNKAKLRKEVLGKLQLLDETSFKTANHSITAKVIHLLQASRVKHICCYVSFWKEVETKTIINFALKSGIKVYVPKVFDNQQMEFYEIFSWADLKKTSSKFLEPVAHHPNLLTDVSLIEMMFIPLTVFDHDLNRIGTGFGYYDRWLNQHSFQGYKIGLAYELSLSKTPIITNEFDVGLDLVICEQNNYLPKTDLKISDEQLSYWRLT